MPDTGAPWNIPYVAPADLIRDYPVADEAQALAIAAGLDEAIIALGPNVAHALKTTSFSTTSATFVDVTDLEVTITPSLTSSKVLVIANIGILSSDQNAAGYVSSVRVVRDSTVISTFGGHSADSTRQSNSPSIVVLDAPNTTSPVTYKVQLVRGVGGNAFVGRTGSDSTARDTSITAIEVAA